MRRRLVAAFILTQVVLVSGRGFAQAPRGAVDSETPEGVARHYVAAMAAADWRGMARLMHPEALKRMHEMFAPLFVSPALDAWRQQLFGVASLDSARAMSDTDVFVAIIGHALSQQGELMQMMRTAKVDFLGHVAEGRDSAHVVYRLTMTVEDVTISREDVITFQRFGTSWRGLLRGDLTILAAAVKRAASS